jgi:hypothetical protein
MKAAVSIAFAVLLSVPAPAKPRDVFPGPCDSVWAAVTATLSDGRNYGIVSIDDLNKRASFTVIGDLTVRTDKVALLSVDGGCQMKLVITQIGSDNSDERGFRNRLKKSMVRLQAAKPPVPAKPPASANPPAPAIPATSVPGMQ